MPVFLQILFLGAALFLVAILVVPTFWRLIRWEIAWDWRIALFGWHAFLLGLALGAIGSFVLVAHWHLQIFRG